MKAFTQGITKQEFLTEIYKHQKLDAFIKGDYSSGDENNFQGCAVGCSLKSVADIKKIKISYSSHKEYENHLGIPQWLARLEDKIFEGLPKARSKTWPVEFAEAINEGSDLSQIFIPMLIFICEQARTKTKNELSHSYIDGVLAELKKPTIDRDALLKARAASRPSYAADAGAYAAGADAASADAGAYAAGAYAADADAGAYAAGAYAADADAAAYAAGAYAAASADAAADAAELAAAFAAAGADAAADARSGVYVTFSKKLLELIRGCHE